MFVWWCFQTCLHSQPLRGETTFGNSCSKANAFRVLQVFFVFIINKVMRNLHMYIQLSIYSLSEIY